MQCHNTKPAQISSGTDAKTVPAFKIKGNRTNTLILANRQESNIPIFTVFKCCCYCVTIDKKEVFIIKYDGISVARDCDM